MPRPSILAPIAAMPAVRAVGNVPRVLNGSNPPNFRYGNAMVSLGMPVAINIYFRFGEF